MKITNRHIHSGKDSMVQPKAQNQAEEGTILQAYKTSTSQISGGVIQQKPITRSISKVLSETRLKTSEDMDSLILFLKNRGYEDRLQEIINKFLDGDFRGTEESSDVSEEDEEAVNWADHQGLENHEDEKAIDQYIEEKSITQFARKPNVVSGPKSYGAYKDVAYKTDDKGCIDFSTTHGVPTAWANPVDPGTEVELSKAGKTINTKDRAQHFAIGDHLLAKTKFGATAKASQVTNYRKSKWTWHHLKDKYKMVLVNMLVHQKHGHNGGVHLW
ncbi:HNH endonuclease [Fluviicola sp.]|uniref:HNH endonuclease n=1 Tax=Fluviicola sp. TaxID=1917219 RepID=UPI0031E3C208